MPATQNSDRRNSWSTGPSRSPGGRFEAPNLAPPSRAGSRFAAALWRTIKTLLLVAALCVGGYYAWLYGSPLWNKMRLNTDVESAAVFFVRQLPKSAATEEELKQRVVYVADDKLKSHLSIKARWYVAFGPSAADLRVLRDDRFSDVEKAFVGRTVDAAVKTRKDPPGTDHEILQYPLGTYTHALTVGEEIWIVVAGWAEDSK